MKNIHSFLITALTLIGLALSSITVAQEYDNLDYECLEIPLEFHDPHAPFNHIECNNGVTSIDTVETPCDEGFYGEDGYNIRAWYFVHSDSDNATQYDFGSISLRHDAEFDMEGSKYFELKRTTLWYYFIQSGNSINRLSIRVKDLSGQGINFGTWLGQGPVFYPDFNAFALAAENFTHINVIYENGILTVEGELERLFIGGDHLYVSNMEFNETTTDSRHSLVEEAVQLYPNPVSQSLFLEGEQLNESQITISDLSGRTVLSERIYGVKWEKNLDFLPAGFFGVHVHRNGNTILSNTLVKN